MKELGYCHSSITRSSLMATGPPGTHASGVLITKCESVNKARRRRAYRMSLHSNLRLLLTTSLFVLALSSMARAQSCLAYGPQVSLSGTLRSQVFPGPPNYESIKQGDSKETAIILTLRRTTCTTGNDPS